MLSRFLSFVSLRMPKGCLRGVETVAISEFSSPESRRELKYGNAAIHVGYGIV